MAHGTLKILQNGDPSQNKKLGVCFMVNICDHKIYVTATEDKMMTTLRKRNLHHRTPINCSVIHKTFFSFTMNGN